MDALGKLGPMMGALLDTAALRQRVIAENLANAETPGYHAREVGFDDAVAKAVQSGDLHAAEGAKPHVTERAGHPKSDGNTVNVELELGEMNRNALAYQSLLAVTLLKKRQLQAAIGGRSG